MAWFKGMDLAHKVTTNKTYIWKGYKTWKKNKGYEKNNKKKFRVVAIDYGIKKNILRYLGIFLILIAKLKLFPARKMQIIYLN